MDIPGGRHTCLRAAVAASLVHAAMLGHGGCVSDFAPGPSKSDPNQLATSEQDATVRDGSGNSDGTQSDASSEAPGSSGDDAAPALPPRVTGPCDLTGRWMITERARTVAYGAEQLNLAWFYLELVQDGVNVTMIKTLYCGGAAKGAPGSLDVLQDDSAAWSAISKKTNYDGRRGSSMESGGMCQVSFERAALIKGMTVATYSDPSVPMPTLAEQATATTPGWEDWDQDGHPGITQVVTGVASGKLYTSIRFFSTYDGSVAANASTFKTSYEWSSDRVVLATEPNDPITRAILASDVQPSPKPGETYVEWARLADGQASDADPDARCAALRVLLPVLNPSANPQ